MVDGRSLLSARQINRILEDGDVAWLVPVPFTVVFQGEPVSRLHAATPSSASDDGHNAPRYLAEVDAFSCAVVA